VPIDARVMFTFSLGTFGDRGVRGVIGSGGDVGADVLDEGTRSGGGGFLRELRRGRGGADVMSSITPNSEVGSERRETDEGKKLLTGSSTLKDGMVGEGGKELAGDGAWW
jgi:hypothetical protein